MLTQKQRTTIAHKQKLNAHLHDYCIEHLYSDNITEQQYNNLMIIHDEPAEVLRRTFFIQDKVYVMPENRLLWSKTQKHGWSISPWSGKKPRNR